jgi:23S rRNA (uridine2552-2'-O)-methyltransferase
MTYRRKDAYYERARAAGYRARSAYKLAELDRRLGLLHRGDFVVDLGAWPGGWLQVALERVGPEGRVVGVDLAAIEPLAGTNVVLVRGDLRDPGTLEAVRGHLGRAADVVLSDLAPKLTGIRATDHARATALVMTALEALPGLLRPGGRLLVKLFMGPEHARVVGRIREAFVDVRATKPDATRPGSSELYVAALGYRGA